MQSRGCDPESACCFLDLHALAVLHLLFRLKARDLPVRPQARHTICRKRQSCGRCTALAIEDAGDLGVGIMCRQSPQQIDRIVGGADRRWMRVRQWGITRLPIVPERCVRSCSERGLSALESPGRRLSGYRGSQAPCRPIRGHGRAPARRGVTRDVRADSAAA